MTDTQHPEPPEDGDESAQARAQQDSAPPETAPGEQQPATPPPEGGTEDGEAPEGAQPSGEQPEGGDESDLADSDRAATETTTGRKKGLMLGLGGAAVVVLVLLVLAAFVWPGFLAGPGTPDAKAEQVTTALGSKNPGELDKVSCHGPDGKSSNQIPPQALPLIQSVKQTGPPHLSLDTEAQVPIELTMNAQGQTQTVPANAVLGVTDGDWCMKGLSQRQ